MAEKSLITEKMIDLLSQPDFISAMIVLELGEKGETLFLDGENEKLKENLSAENISYEDFLAMVGLMQQAGLVFLHTNGEDEFVALTLTKAGQKVYQLFSQAILVPPSSSA